MSHASGFIAGYLLDGKGTGASLEWEQVQGWTPEQGTLWVHLDYTVPGAATWMTDQAKLNTTVASALTAEETRPRCALFHGGLLVVLRGVNLNPGSDREDMVAVRIWLDENRIITTRHRHVKAIEAIREALTAGEGPVSSADFLVDVADALTTRIGTVLTDVFDSVDGLEDEVLTTGSAQLRTKIASLRREIISLRRYLAPQRDAMSRPQNERVTWIDDESRARLREISDRTTRYVEDLDSARDRASVTQDELNSRMSDRMNKTMFVLSIIAGIFLPLGLLTGLLGINVGGIPGTESPYAFVVVCVSLLVVAIGQIALFKRMGWL